MGYTRTVVLDVPYEEAVPKVKEAFQTHGFGTLTEIDVKATLQSKIGVEMEPYVILGACNPHLAHQALTADPEVGALLPCNVVVRRDGDRTLVHALDPEVIGRLADVPESIAREAGELIQKALDSLTAS
ncbi:MAG: ABC transporter ATP-binding protein [Acidimicrobiia bacterium]|nr:MAG: ABC transporter ATP-binding protein [Acidimicrobiia bacterium]